MADVNGCLSMLYESILSRDIIARHRLRSPAQFSRVARVVMERYAQEVSFRNLVQQLEITNVRTVQNYVYYMERAYLVLSLKRYSTKRAERTKIGKVYVIDPGFITHFTGVAESGESRGHRLENIVYLQLRTLRKALNCTVLVLVTDHENGEEKRGDLTVRIVDAPSWLMEMKSVSKG